MKGTFKPGDKLTIEMVAFKHIKKGDVIIFRRTHEDHNDFIVHRVAVITPNGLITRGDNCKENDIDPVQGRSIIGRVIQYNRRRKVRRTWKGCAGNIRAAVLHARANVVKWFSLFLRRPFNKLKKTGIIARLWHPTIEMILFETSDGVLLKYIHKGNTVSIKWIHNKICWTRHPYDLVIDI